MEVEETIKAVEVEDIKAMEVEDIKEEEVVVATSTQTIEVAEVVAIKVAEVDRIRTEIVELKLIGEANGYALYLGQHETHMHNIIAALKSFGRLKQSILSYFLTLSHSLICTQVNVLKSIFWELYLHF